MRKKRQRRSDEPRLFDLIEEAYALLRGLKVSDWFWFHAGTCPFVLLVITFWMDLAKYESSPGFMDIAWRAALLAVCYIWMKGCQSIFGRMLLSRLHGEELNRVTLWQGIRNFIEQGAVQATSWIVLPVSLIVVLPFGWAIAFYQNFGILGQDMPLKESLRSSWRQALKWPKLNHLVIWLASPFLLVLTVVTIHLTVSLMIYISPDIKEAGDYVAIIIMIFMLIFGLLMSPLPFVVAVNCGVAMFMLPQMLQTFLGIDTMFTMSRGAITGTTFQLIVCGMTYLIMEPVFKAAYAVRCFRGLSLKTGKDISLALKKRQRAAAMALLLLLIGLPHVAVAQSAVNNPEQPVKYSADQLQEQISTVLESGDFDWRKGRKLDLELDPLERPGWMAWIDDRMGELKEWSEGIIESIEDYLDELFKREEQQQSEPIKTDSVFELIRIGIYLLLGLALLYLLFVIFRRVRAVPKIEMTPVRASPLAESVEDENVLADEAQPDEWWQLGLELMGQQKFRLAIRAFYLSSLSGLAERQFISIARFKTNKQYWRELVKTCRHRPEAVSLFQQNTRDFEGCWYGDHPVDETHLNDFMARVKQMGGQLES